MYIHAWNAGIQAETFFSVDIMWVLEHVPAVWQSFGMESSLRLLHFHHSMKIRNFLGIVYTKCLSCQPCRPKPVPQWRTRFTQSVLGKCFLFYWVSRVRNRLCLWEWSLSLAPASAPAQNQGMTAAAVLGLSSETRVKSLCLVLLPADLRCEQWEKGCRKF